MSSTAAVTANSHRISLPVGGMTCAACVSHVDKALRAEAGVQDVSVNLMTRSATVVVADDADVERLVQAVTGAGYTAHAPADDDDVLLEQQQGDAALAHEARQRLIRAVVSLMGAMAAMVLSMPLMHGSRSDVVAHALMGVMDPPIRAVIPWLYDVKHDTLLATLLLTTVPVLLWAVWPIGVRALLAARSKNTDMNTLVVLGVAASVASSLLGEIAIDAALFITGFVLLGQAIEASARGRTSAALHALASLRVDVAHRELEDGSVVDVTPADLRIDDVVVVRPGERLPGDGVVVDGGGSVDESLLTGESRPVTKVAGDGAIGGSVNGSQPLKLRLQQLGKDSTLHGLLRLLREAQASRAPTQRVADRVAAVFVPAMIALAALTFALWFFISGIDDATRFAVAVLVVACPCAMGLAVPTAVVVATGKAAGAGILIKGGDILERSAGIDTVVFDKTGTLTEGRPAVVDVVAVVDDVSVEDVSVDDVIAIAAGLEKSSEHPLGLAIVAACQARGKKPRRVKEVVAVAGAGLQGSIDGVVVGIGNERLLTGLGVVVDGTAGAVAASLAAGRMPLIVVAGGRAIGVIALDDAVRDDAALAIAALRGAGIRVRMLTGDRRATADRVGLALGLTPGDIDAEVLPADKLRVVQALSATNAVAFVGDGVNDAAALAAATVGVGMGTGTDVAVAAADIALMRPRLMAIADVVRLARRTRRIMLQNLGWAFGYNLVMLPLAAGALSSFGVALSPILASVAMSLSSVTVVANSLRLSRFKMTP